MTTPESTADYIKRWYANLDAQNKTKTNHNFVQFEKVIVYYYKNQKFQYYVLHIFNFFPYKNICYTTSNANAFHRIKLVHHDTYCDLQYFKISNCQNYKIPK